MLREMLNISLNNLTANRAVPVDEVQRMIGQSQMLRQIMEFEAQFKDSVLRNKEVK